MSQKSTYGDNVISLRDVKIVQKNFTVLSNVNLTIKKGKFNYLIGKTGSEKNNLLKVLYGHLPSLAVGADGTLGVRGTPVTGLTLDGSVPVWASRVDMPRRLLGLPLPLNRRVWLVSDDTTLTGNRRAHV